MSTDLETMQAKRQTTVMPSKVTPGVSNNRQKVNAMQLEVYVQKLKEYQ